MGASSGLGNIPGICSSWSQAQRETQTISLVNLRVKLSQ